MRGRALATAPPVSQRPLPHPWKQQSAQAQRELEGGGGGRGESEGEGASEVGECASVQGAALSSVGASRFEV